MLLLQSGPGPAPGRLVTNPFDYHVLLFIAMLVYGLITAFFPASRAPQHWARRHKMVLLAITGVNAIVFTWFIYHAFSNKNIVGYEMIEQWGWLDSLYSYEAVYDGELSAIRFLYLLPVAAAGLSLFFFPTFEERMEFAGTFVIRYPVIIILSYVILFLSLPFFSLDLSRLTVSPASP